VFQADSLLSDGSDACQHFKTVDRHAPCAAISFILEVKDRQTDPRMNNHCFVDEKMP
jgi:hypothetical protein